VYKYKHRFWHYSTVQLEECLSSQTTNDNNNDNDDDDNNSNDNNNTTYGTGLLHAQGYYDDDDRSTDEGMHRIKPGH